MSGVMSGQKQAMAQQKQMMANHREAIHAIRDFDFPSDDAGFYKAAISIADDYSACSVGPFWDRDYRAAYKKRIKRELKELKGSNQERYEKLLEAYNEAKAELRKKVIIRLIIGVVVALAVIIFAATAFQSDDASGAIIGLCMGFVFFWFPFLVGRSKQQEE